jgi:hypothetical protein
MAFDPTLPFEEVDELEPINEEPIVKPAASSFDINQPFEEVDESSIGTQASIPYQYDKSRFRPKAKTPEEKEVGTIEGITNAAKNAFDSSRQAMDVIGGVTPEEAKNISKIEYDKQSRKLAPGYDEYQKAEGMDAVWAFAKNPIEVTSNIIAEGLAGSLPALGAGLAAGGVGAAAGSVFPVIGTGVGFTAGQVAGTFAGSLATEYGGKILEEMQNEGMDIQDPESIQKFFANQTLVDAAKDKALKRGVPIAAFDAISAGIGGKLARLTGKQFVTKTGEAAAEVGVQAGLGGGGEVAGSLVAGDPIEGKAVFGEIIGEAGPGAAEIVTGRIADRQARLKAQADAKVKAASELSTTLEENNAPLTANVIKSQTATSMEQDKLAADLEDQLDAIQTAPKAKPTKAGKLPTDFLPVETPGATYGREEGIYDVFSGIRRKPLDITQPAEPTAQPPIIDATQEIIQQEGVRQEPQDGTQVRPTAEAIVSDSLQPPARGEEEGQVIFGLQSVADNTATREQISALSEAGLVDIVKGKPVINEDGAAILAQPAAPAIVEQEPVTTPALEEAVTPAPIAEAPVVSEEGGQVSEVTPTPTIAEEPQVSPEIQDIIQRAESAATREEASQIGRDFAALDPSLPPPPSAEYEIVKAISDKAGRRPYNADVLTEENITAAKEAGLVTKTKVPKLTESGRNLVTDGARVARDREMAIGDITDRVTDQTVSAWDAKNDPASSAFQARIATQQAAPTIAEAAPVAIVPPKVENVSSIPTLEESKKWDDLSAYQKPIIESQETESLDLLASRVGVKRQGVSDIKLQEKIITNTHPDDIQDALVELKLSPPAPVTEQAAPAEAPAPEVAPIQRNTRDETYENLLNAGSPAGKNMVELTEKQITPAIRKKLRSERDVQRNLPGRPEETASFYLKPKADVTGNPSDRGWILKDKRPDLIARSTPALVEQKPSKPLSVMEQANANFTKKYGMTPDEARNKFLKEKKLTSEKLNKLPLDKQKELFEEYNSWKENLITAQEPVGIAVGNRVKLGKSPQTYTIEEVIPQTANDKKFGEQYYNVKNEKTGETQVVEKNDMKPVRAKGDVRLNPLGYDIADVVEDINQGKTDTPLRAVNQVIEEATELRNRVAAESTRRKQPRKMGKAAILERIARERSAGNINEKTAKALTDFINRVNEDAIWDTAISIRAKGVSNFDFGDNLVTFFLNQDKGDLGASVGIHEFWHGLSRFLPDAEVEKINKDYTKELADYLKKNPWFLAFVGRYSLTPEQFEAYKKFNPEEAETKLTPVKDEQGNIVKYKIKFDKDNYRYIMLDEFIAEKMTDLVLGKQQEPNTFLGKLAKVLREFIALIKASSGFDVYEKFYQAVTSTNGKLTLQRQSGVAPAMQIYEPLEYDYSTRRMGADLKSITPITPEEVTAFEKASSNKVMARNPELAVAAVRMKNGEITVDEYADLVDSIDPFTAKGPDPIPTKEKIQKYIAADKTGQVMQPIESGKEVEFRIDIPTYNRSTAAGDTVYAVTAHEPVATDAKGVGKVISFVGVAKVNNPTFMTRSVSGKGAAIDIATGAGKFPLATVKGKYEPITELPADINDPNVWTEVGYNPIRSSYFVDVRTKNAVIGGDEAIMVGSRVFVKNPQMEARPKGLIGPEKRYMAVEAEPNIENAERIDFDNALQLVESLTGETGDAIKALAASSQKLSAALQNIKVQTGSPSFDGSVIRIRRTDNTLQTKAHEVTHAILDKAIDEVPEFSKAIGKVRSEFLDAADSNSRTYAGVSKETRIKMGIVEVIFSQALSMYESFGKNRDVSFSKYFSDNLQFIARASAGGRLGTYKITDQDVRFAYALTGKHEFLAAMMSDSEFRDLSKTLVPYKEPKQKSLFQKFIEAIKKIFGKKIAKEIPSTQLDVTMRLIEDVINNEAYAPGPYTRQYGRSFQLQEMEAEPRTEQVAGRTDRGTDIITTPEGIIRQTNEVLRTKFFDGTTVSDESTKNAWSYIERLLDIESGNANELAGEINDVVDADTNSDSRMGASLLSVSLTNYAAKLAAQGDSRMLSYLVRRVNRMPVDKYAGGRSDAGRALRAAREYDIDGYAAIKVEQDAKTERTAAEIFGNNKPSKEQVDAVSGAIDAADNATIGTPEEVASDVEKIEKRTKRNITKKLETLLKKGSLKEMIASIKNTPLEEQQAPGWIEKVIKGYLEQAGLTGDAATTAAKLYDSILSERFVAAKQKAFEETLGRSAPWNNYLSRNSRMAKDSLKKIQVAIRTGVLDPSKTIESVIAKENGWDGFTKEQFEKIVQLDNIINNPDNDDVTRREAMSDLNKIIVDAKLPVRFKDALGAYYVGNALMGIPTVTVNIASPIGFTVRNMMTDIGKYAFTDPARIPIAFESFLDSMRSLYDQTSYAFKNQIYLNDVVEYLQGQNVLRELFDKGKKQWANGEYAAGFVNMAVGMTQITGRVLSSLDQGAIAMLENQNITRYAMEALAANTKGRVPKDKLKEFANMVLHTKRRVIAESIASGMPRDRAGVLADLAVKSEVISALSSEGVNPMDVLDASINDALLSVGRNKAITIKGAEKENTNLSDEGMLSYLPISFLQTIASGAARQGSGMQIFSKMLYGFALVPARVFHNVAWFSPYGFIRLGVDKYKKSKGQDSPYAMSLQTDAQFKQRLTEAIAGSIVMLGLAALRAGSSDDEDDRQFRIVITGNGPSATTDRQYFDSWNKKWKPYSIHIVVGDTIIPINIGRGGEALFFPIMLAGAMDDWEIKKKQNDTKKEPEDLSAMASMLGSSFFALAQRGPYAAFTKPLFDASKDGRVTEELASQAGYFGKTFIPFLGTSVARNITDFINDPVDRSSVEGAIYANTPIVGPWMGAKALNALGQPVRADDWGDKLFKLGVPVVFSFPKNTPMNELNELILKQGSGPSIPTRTNAQKRFGDILTDDEFESYVREYGKVMSDRMFKNRSKLERMKPSDYDDELEKYARGYSAGDFKVKGASDMAVQAVKRMRQ